MKIGAEDKKKVYFLAVLGLGALYGVYSTFSGPSIPSSTPAPAVRDRTAVDVPSIPAPTESARPAPAALPAARNSTRCCAPSARKIKSIRFTIDPEIKLNILAKLQQVPAAGSGRNLFQFGAAAPVEFRRGPKPT